MKRRFLAWLGTLLLQWSGEPEYLDDGFGNRWSRVCPECGHRSMYISRPGDVRCKYCD